MGALWQDVKYGLRSLHRQLGFSTVGVSSLSLGIGATTASVLIRVLQ